MVEVLKPRWLTLRIAEDLQESSPHKHLNGMTTQLSSTKLGYSTYLVSQRRIILPTDSPPSK